MGKIEALLVLRFVCTESLYYVPVEGDEGHSWDADPAAEGESHRVAVLQLCGGGQQGEGAEGVALQVEPQLVLLAERLEISGVTRAM